MGFLVLYWTSLKKINRLPPDLVVKQSPLSAARRCLVTIVSRAWITFWPRVLSLLVLRGRTGSTFGFTSRMIVRSRVQIPPRTQVGQPSRLPSGGRSNGDCPSLKAAKEKKYAHHNHEAGSQKKVVGVEKNMSLLYDLYRWGYRSTGYPFCIK